MKNSLSLISITLYCLCIVSLLYWNDQTTIFLLIGAGLTQSIWGGLRLVVKGEIGIESTKE